MWVSFKIRVELQTEHRSFQLLLLLAANGWGCQVSGDCCCVLDFSMVGHSSSCGMGLWCLPVTNLLCQKCSGSTTTIVLPCFYITQSKLNLRPAGLFSCWILWPIFCKTSLEIGWLMSHFRRIDTGAASLGNTRARRRYQSFTHFTSSSACFSCLELLLTQTRKFSKLHSAGWNISVSTGIFKVLSPVFVMLSCLWFNKVELWSEGFSWGSGIH